MSFRFSGRAQHIVQRLTACLFICVVLFGNSVLALNQNRQAAIDLLISGGTVVTMNADHRVIEDGAVAVRRNRIVEVGRRVDLTSKYAPRQTINARGKVVIPGLINGHTHIPMTLFRGLADDLDLSEWLTKYIFPAEAKNVTEEFVRAGTRLGLSEMVRGGTTTYCDMYYFEDAIADETARAGVRAVLGETIIDFPAPDNKTHEDALRYTKRFVSKWQNHPLITPAIAPHAPYTVSAEHLRAIRDFADRTRAPVVIHIAETRKEVDDSRTSKSATPIQYLANLNFLNSSVIAAHVVFADATDILTLKRYGVGVVHNPQSNMKLASGIAPVPQMLAAGLSVGLGTDGAASNNDLNLWEEMDTAAKLHKAASGNPRILAAREAFAMATIDGARALHMNNLIGSLEAEKLADIVVVDFDGVHQTPGYDVYSQLVYATKAADVRTVIINGRVVMRDRRLLTLDEPRIKQQARFYRERISRSLATK